MVALFDHCTFNLNPRATSIDTPLHAFVPARTSITSTPTR
jgi:rhamnose utilization protein RhaD (predicted bifunctional aldolase and dehydrogenase)